MKQNYQRVKDYRNKSKRVELNFRKKEAAQLQQYADECGLPLATFIKLVLDKYFQGKHFFPEALHNQLKSLYRQLNGVSVNINQLSRVCNSKQQFEQGALTTLNKCVLQINKQLQNFFESIDPIVVIRILLKYNPEARHEILKELNQTSNAND